LQNNQQIKAQKRVKEFQNKSKIAEKRMAVAVQTHL
jgi:hypothetical protein